MITSVSSIVQLRNFKLVIVNQFNHIKSVIGDSLKKKQSKLHTIYVVSIKENLDFLY